MAWSCLCCSDKAAPWRDAEQPVSDLSSRRIGVNESTAVWTCAWTRCVGGAKTTSLARAKQLVLAWQIPDAHAVSSDLRKSSALKVCASGAVSSADVRRVIGHAGPASAFSVDVPSAAFPEAERS